MYYTLKLSLPRAAFLIHPFLKENYFTQSKEKKLLFWQKKKGQGRVVRKYEISLQIVMKANCIESLF